MSRPKWATPVRLAFKDSLLYRLDAFEVDLWSGEFYLSPKLQKHIHDLVKDWIRDDAEQRRYDWLVAQKGIHESSDRVLPPRGRFSAVSRDVYHDSQPLYHVLAIGVSPLNHRPFAKVRIASSYECLFIDLGEMFRPLSKNQRRKIARHNKSFPAEIASQITYSIRSAVKHYRKTE